MHWCVMLQNLGEQIRECYRRAEQSRRFAETALTPSVREDFFAMERRWLSLAHSYEFSERLSASQKRSERQKQQNEVPPQA
jgi:hypothetical protein